jgi:beta-N-acetylhexosaminidase
VLLVGLPGVTDAAAPLAAEVAALGVGGILVTKTNVVDGEQITALLRDLRAASPGPLVVATDEEPGRVSSFGAVLGRTSAARTLARRADLDAARDLAEAQGAALRNLGVDVVLAPVADLDAGPWSGVIGDRSFSADPEVARDYVGAWSDGLTAGGVLPTAKHFPGHGRSPVDSHLRAAVVDDPVAELVDTDLLPFRAQIDDGVPAVMLAHVTFTDLDDDLPASLSPAAYALLRDLGFAGVAMTDSLGMGAINLRWDFPEAAVLAVAAGADAVLATDGAHAVRMRDAIVAAVEEGEIPEARLDEAVARMRLLAGEDPRGLVCVDVPFPALARSTAEVEPPLR